MRPKAAREKRSFLAVFYVNRDEVAINLFFDALTKVS